MNFVRRVASRLNSYSNTHEIEEDDSISSDEARDSSSINPALRTDHSSDQNVTKADEEKTQKEQAPVDSAEAAPAAAQPPANESAIPLMGTPSEHEQRDEQMHSPSSRASWKREVSSIAASDRDSDLQTEKKPSTSSAESIFDDYPMEDHQQWEAILEARIPEIVQEKDDFDRKYPNVRKKKPRRQTYDEGTIDYPGIGRLTAAYWYEISSNGGPIGQQEQKVANGKVLEVFNHGQFDDAEVETKSPSPLEKMQKETPNYSYLPLLASKGFRAPPGQFDVSFLSALEKEEKVKPQSDHYASQRQKKLPRKQKLHVEERSKPVESSDSKKRKEQKTMKEQKKKKKSKPIESSNKKKRKGQKIRENTAPQVKSSDTAAQGTFVLSPAEVKEKKLLDAQYNSGLPALPNTKIQNSAFKSYVKPHDKTIYTTMGKTFRFAHWYRKKAEFDKVMEKGFQHSFDYTKLTAAKFPVHFPKNPNDVFCGIGNAPECLQQHGYRCFVRLIDISVSDFAQASRNFKMLVAERVLELMKKEKVRLIFWNAVGGYWTYLERKPSLIKILQKLHDRSRETISEASPLKKRKKKSEETRTTGNTTSGLFPAPPTPSPKLQDRSREKISEPSPLKKRKKKSEKTRTTGNTTSGLFPAPPTPSPKLQDRSREKISEPSPLKKRKKTSEKTRTTGNKTSGLFPAPPATSPTPNIPVSQVPLIPASNLKPAATAAALRPIPRPVSAFHQSDTQLQASLHQEATGLPSSGTHGMALDSPEELGKSRKDADEAPSPKLAAPTSVAPDSFEAQLRKRMKEDGRLASSPPDARFARIKTEAGHHDSAR